MHWSKLFIPTLRDDPADAEVASHKLLLRAGYIRQLSAGIYSHLFLAQRSLLKITAIVREEMDAIGAQEFHLPALNPAEVWQESGRWDAMGDNLFRLKDRFQREQYRGHPAFDKTVDFCERWDQESFDPSYDTLPLAVFEPMLRRIFAREPWGAHTR